MKSGISNLHLCSSPLPLLELAQIPSISTFKRPDKYIAIKARITAIYYEDRVAYGYRCISDVLHKKDERVNHKKVQRIV
ncbi:transposase [Paenibacillus sp. GSMTC-2017]|uniref:IS3 family transposase n=1 Tax=Paenibacillus sp. GSMTC-2017 TaxID=2794350 RepID=UPI0018D9BD47|nr:transposase [Paenibacillus sp. GSMTC-2017]